MTKAVGEVPVLTEVWGIKKELVEIAEAIREAKNEWIAAQRFFAEVTDPDLVDQAIYRLEAAERKYMYLWKEVRNNGQASRNKSC